MKKWHLVLIGIAGLLLVLRAALPAIALHYINKTMEDLGPYTGSAQNFSLALWRGAYQISGIEIKKKESDHSLFTVDEVDIGVEWGPLLTGDVLASVTIWGPVFRYRQDQIVIDPEEADPEATRRMLETLSPLRVETFEVRNGRFEYLDAEKEVAEQDRIHISQIDLDAHNLHTRPSDSSGGPFWVNGKIMGKDSIHAEGNVNPLTDPLAFDIEFEVDRFDVTGVNPMLRHFIPIDFQKGFLSIAGEAAQKEENFAGYVTIGFEDGNVIAPAQDFESLKHFIFEIAGGIGNFLLQNSKDQVIVTFPLKKTEEGYGVDTENIVENVLEGQDKQRVQIQDSIHFDRL